MAVEKKSESHCDINLLREESYLNDFDDKKFHDDAEAFFKNYNLDKKTIAQLICAISIMIHSPEVEGRHKATLIVKDIFKESNLTEEQQHDILDFVSNEFTMHEHV